MRRLALLLVLSAACTAPSAGAPSPTAPATSSVAPETGAPTGTPAATAASATPEPTAERDALLDLIRSGELPAYKITYAVTTAGAAGPASLVGWTQVHSPPRFRSDLTARDAGKTQTIITILTEDAYYLCMDAEGQQACFEFATAEDAAMIQTAQAPQPLPEDVESWSFAHLETRTLAGVQARCYEMSDAAAAGQSATACYSVEGVPLYIRTTSEGVELTMEATSYTTAVSDADFELPYAVTRLPGY